MAFNWDELEKKAKKKDQKMYETMRTNGAKQNELLKTSTKDKKKNNTTFSTENIKKMGAALDGAAPFQCAQHGRSLKGESPEAAP